MSIATETIPKSAAESNRAKPIRATTWAMIWRAVPDAAHVKLFVREPLGKVGIYEPQETWGAVR
jgi:hypothetical protein